MSRLIGDDGDLSDGTPLIGDLLDHLQRIRDSAGPERIPDPIDLVSDFTGYHVGATDG